MREAACDHPVQDVVVLPDAQFHLHRRDLGDAPGLLDLSDVHVAQTDRVDVAIALQGVERAHARRERHTWIRRVQLVEVNAIDAERAAAGLARGGQVARPAVRHPAALRTCKTAFGRHAKSRSVPSQVDIARAMSRSLCPASPSSQQYTSAVSSSVIPASKAACSTATARSSSRSRSVDRRMQPSATRGTPSGDRSLGTIVEIIIDTPGRQRSWRMTSLIPTTEARITPMKRHGETGERRQQHEPRGDRAEPSCPTVFRPVVEIPQAQTKTATGTATANPAPAALTFA